MIFTTDTKRQVKRYSSYNLLLPCHLPSGGKMNAEAISGFIYSNNDFIRMKHIDFTLNLLIKFVDSNRNKLRQ